MKALTVQQPWAWAIVHGGKDVENRTQAWSYRGPLAIHAGARMSPRGEQSPLVREGLRRAAMSDEIPDDYLVRGAILGVVDLVDVHTSWSRHGAITGTVPCCDSPWAESSYAEHGGRTRRDVVHLVLENPRPLEVPIACRGALGLWSLPAEVEAQLEGALR